MTKAYLLDNLNLTGDFSVFEKVATLERLEKIKGFLFEKDKNRSLVAYALLEYALAENSDWKFRKDAKFKLVEYGKPEYKDCPLRFSISHSKNVVAVAVDRTPVGIDVENFFEVSAEVVKRVCSQNEIAITSTDSRAFFDFWTLKESYLKCKGIGISTCLRELDFAKGMGITSKFGDYYLFSKRFSDYSLGIAKTSDGKFNIEKITLEALEEFVKNR